ncbi:MAG TPA: hypothetical protein VGL40_08015 [Bacillota bacterium]
MNLMLAKVVVVTDQPATTVSAALNVALDKLRPAARATLVELQPVAKLVPVIGLVELAVRSKN